MTYGKRTLRGLAVAAVMALAAGGLASAAVWAGAVGGQTGFHEHHGLNGEVDINVCPDNLPLGYAACHAHIRTDDFARSSRPHRPGLLNGLAAAATVGNNGAYDPSYLQSAYNAPSMTSGYGQTVAIVDAFDDPNAEKDLAVYRSTYNLPPCTTANGCFRKVGQNGGGTLGTPPDTGWALEISLDLDMVSAMCPNCKIILVEAKTNLTGNLDPAENTAAALGARVISNSWGGGESSAQTSNDTTYFNHPGVAITASTGDNGYGVSYPASSRFVTAVGGTSLFQSTNTGSRAATETAWSGAGSGCSAYEPKPAWQHDTGCANKTIADVSAVADPNTGVWVYDTFGQTGWVIVGGTSAAAPIVASMYALAGNTESTDNVSVYPYNDLAANSAALFDVVSGSNGSCGGTYLCTALAGFDGPTGLGTPNSTLAFEATANATVPSAPQSAHATPGNGRVTLAWSPPLSNGGAAITSYNVYRGTASGGESLIRTGVTSLGFTDTGLTNGTKYYYLVTAVNSIGQGAPSAEVSATPATLPGAPTALTARTGSLLQVALSWNAPAGNGGSPVTSYAVYRGQGSGAETSYATAACTASTCSYTDTKAIHGKVYFYKVAAINAVGAGPLSNEASAAGG